MVENGEWVILMNNEIIDHDKDVKEILKRSEKYNKEDIVISKIPASKYGFY